MRKASNTVGCSSRTPFKHWLFDTSLGKVIGAISNHRKTPCNPTIHIVDMCAGDGFGHDGKYDSSPGIIHKHVNSTHPASLKVAKRAHLYEIQTETFNRLRSRFGGIDGMSLNRQDSTGWTIRDIPTAARDCIYVYADPNSVATLPITREFIHSLTPETLFLMTLGCNASGCKRRPREEREGWLHTANMVADAIHRRHDLLLIWLTNDDHQWAYLMSTPQVWAADQLGGAIKKGNTIWEKGVEGLSLRIHGRRAISRKFDNLFYTKEEVATS
ncbi:MAG: hypothetical protein ACO3LT_06865 [Ilumatobacteraceae bacterium]